MDKVKKKIKHLKRYFGFKKEELGEIRKMYSGEFFDPTDPAYLRLLEISEKLCKEFSNLTGKLGKKPSLFQIVKTYFKKQAILKRLFPIHGILSGVGENLSLVIGLVDFNGCGFTNRSVWFSPYSLVECENYTIFATKIRVGADAPERSGALIKLLKVHIGNNTWICGGVEIRGNVSIGDRTVIGAGARVISDIESDVLALGRPCKTVKKIDKNYRSKKDGTSFFDEGRKKEIFEHLRRVGYRRKSKEYVKMLDGKYFNSTNLRLGGMFIYTHRLCSEYNAPNTSEERKKEILQVLFPDHGENLKVGGDLFVDMLGMTKIGNNVTIGDSVYMSGPIRIESDTKIGNDVLMFGTGHTVESKGRRVGFSLSKGLYEYSQSAPITVRKNVEIGDHSVIVPGSDVSADVPNASLFVKNKLVT